MVRGRFAKDDAVTPAGPVGWNQRHLKAGGGELVDQDLLGNAVPAVVLGYPFYWRDKTKRLARRKVDNGEQTTRFERTEEAGVNFGRMAEMMVDVAHEDRIATFRRKIGVGFAGFDDSDVREFSPDDSCLDIGQPLGIQFR